MKRLILIVMMLITGVMVTSAQGDDDTCEIDLSSAASLIVEAQAQASRGDREGALRSIALAQEILDDAVERCGSAFETDATPTDAEADAVETDPALALEDIYASVNGAFMISVPGGWVTETATTLPGGGIVLLGSDAVALEEVSNEIPDLNNGEYAIGFVIGTAENVEGSLSPDASLDEVVDAYRNQLAETEGTELSETQSLTINAQDARSFNLLAETFAGSIIALDLDDNTYAVTVALSSPDELAIIEATAINILASLEYTP